MSDLIDRQAAIDAIRASRMIYSGTWGKGLAMAEERLRNLPSAQPYTDEEIQAIQDLESAEIEKAYELGRESAQQWIPCSERLPKVGQDILMSVGGIYTAEGCLREDGDWAQFRWNGIQRKDMVGAWMPLPEPWKGEQP